MRRIVTACAVVGLFVGMAGCGGGDDLGMPKDTSPATPDLDMTTKFQKMNDAMKTAKSKSATPAL